MADLPGFKYYKTISVDNNKINTALSWFPLAIPLGASVGLSLSDVTDIFDIVGDNFYKIAVTTADGVTQLFVEVEQWSSVNSRALLWVSQADWVLSDTESTQIRLYFDNSAPDNTAYVGLAGTRPEVWRNEFAGVYTLAQNPALGSGAVKDSSGNNRHGTSSGSMTTDDVANNIIGSGLDFDGVNDCVDIATLPRLQIGSPHTVFGSAKLVSGNATDAIFFSSTSSSMRAGIIIREDGNLAYGLYNGSSYVVAKSGPAPDNAPEIQFCATYDGSIGKLYINGVLQTGTLNPYLGATNECYIGAADLKGRPFKGNIGRLFVANNASVFGESWIVADYHNHIDDLLTFGETQEISNDFLIRALDQPFYLQVDYFISGISQVYHLPHPIQAEQDQIYGLRLAQLLTQRFADSPACRALLHSWYSALPTLQKTLWQQYGSPLELRAKLAQQYRDALRSLEASGQPYTVAHPLLSLLRQLYTVSGTALKTATDQPSSLAENDYIKSKLQQIYMSASAGSQSLHSFSVTIGGRSITSFVAVDIEAGRDQYCLTGDIQIKSQGEYLQCAVGELVTVTHNGDEYQFIVESLARSRNPGEASYTVNMASPAILLDAPHALPITKEYAPNMASAIAQEIVAPFGIVLVWQLVDWPIPKNTLYATDETPLDVLRRLVGAVGGVLQSLPDGSLVACPRYPVDIDKLAAGTIGHYYTDADNMFSVADSLSIRSGQNVYLISDGLLSEKSHELRQVDIEGDAYARMIQAYIVPWTGDGVDLSTSGGEWVSIEPMGIVTEEITEQVEFVNGAGSTSSPIYAMLSREWNNRSLGAITYGEDGSLTSEVDGESLAQVTYQTRYHKWVVRDREIENVQFILTAA